MEKIKLRDWKNKDKVGTRFPESNFPCPDCEQPVLLDEWPPNQSFGSWTSQSSEFRGSQKYVCTNCKIAFKTRFCQKQTNGVITENTEEVVERASLVKYGDEWLTPHDVWREEYKKEHGKYPREAYA